MMDARAYANLAGVHDDLIRVTKRAFELSSVPFTVTEGLRTLARQKQLVEAGASWTLKSRHLTGHAVDLAPLIGGRVRWDWPPFYELARAMKQAAADLGVAIEWGGDWRKKKDGPHFQLPWKQYPAKEET